MMFSNTNPATDGFGLKLFGLLHIVQTGPRIHARSHNNHIFMQNFVREENALFSLIPESWVSILEASAMCVKQLNSSIYDIVQILALIAHVDPLKQLDL